MRIIEQIRSFRILDIALFDVIGSYVVVYYLCKYKQYSLNKTNLILSTVLLQSIIIHLLVGKETTLIKKLNEPNFNFHKLIILVNLLVCYYLSY